MCFYSLHAGVSSSTAAVFFSYFMALRWFWYSICSKRCCSCEWWLLRPCWIRATAMDICQDRGACCWSYKRLVGLGTGLAIVRCSIPLIVRKLAAHGGRMCTYSRPCCLPCERMGSRELPGIWSEIYWTNAISKIKFWFYFIHDFSVQKLIKLNFHLHWCHRWAPRKWLKRRWLQDIDCSQVDTVHSIQWRVADSVDRWRIPKMPAFHGSHHWLC